MEEYYTSYDMALLADKLVTHFAFLTMNWRNMLGRPTITLVAAKSYLDEGKIPLAMITTMKKLKSGYINGTRVTLGNLNDFLSTSCITNLSFLGCHEDGLPDSKSQMRGVVADVSQRNVAVGGEICRKRSKK
jgi:phosphorylase kinase alpha/beta subunit